MEEHPVEKIPGARKQKVIFHMDGDAFFVACEVAKNPKLRGLPVVTGEERGIVSALSYEAKALGIKRGMPIFKLKKEFPQVLVLPGDYASYARLSQAMFNIVRRYADDVEEYSIDECFADLTGLDKPLYMTYREIAERIRKEVTQELGLSVSIGVAPTKCLAKVASKWQKPNGLTMISKEDAPEFLAKTPIEKIWGIGRQTSMFLWSKGVNTAQDFTGKSLEWVKENLSVPYQAIWHELNSVPIMEIDPNPKTEYASVQKTRTFHPATNEKKFLFSQLSKHIEDACKKVRHYGLVPRRVSFFLKTKDFRYHSVGSELEVPSNAPEVILEVARKNFRKMWKPDILYRTAGVTLHELRSDVLKQGDLFGDGNRAEKLDMLHKHIDGLEEKFGKRVVYLGSSSRALKQKRKGTDADDLDRNLLFL